MLVTSVLMLVAIVFFVPDVLMLLFALFQMG